MESKVVLRRLLNYLYGAKKLFFAAFACTLITVCASLAGPLLIGKTMDAMPYGKAVLPLLIALAAVYAASSLFSWSNTYLINRLAQNTVNRLRRQMMDKLGKLPVKSFDTTPHGEFVSRLVNDADIVTDGLMQGLLNLLSGVVTIAGAIVFMLLINWMMTLVVLASAPIAFFVARFITMNTQKYFKEQAKTLGELNSFAEEMITGHRTVSAFGCETENEEKFKSVNNVLYGSGLKSQFFSALANPTTRLVNNITFTAVGVIGSILAITRGLTVGDISSFLIYASLFAKPFNEITGVLTQVQSALASAARVFSVLDMQEEEDGGTFLPASVIGEVAFSHVDFSYNPKVPLIKDFNFTAKAGEKIAIVGRTGSGKTTLVNLLMRFYETQNGKITLDGADITSMPRDVLRKNFGMVLQDTWLFGGTIRENIAYAKPDAPIEEVIAAAKAAEAHGFIRKLSKGYDTLLAEAADSISQGQKQLMTIARVVLADPPVLILDEATSNIDTLTEVKIQRALDRLMQGRTSFVIAHRLSTIENADRIIVLADGKIIETGNHAELLAKDGEYAAMLRSRYLAEALPEIAP